MRVPKPWFRKQNSTWYVQLDGRQFNLGQDEKEAQERYHRLMVQRGQGVVNGEFSVRYILGAYWHWAKKNLAPSTCKRRKPVLKSFGDFVPNNLKAHDLKAYHVQQWLMANGKVKQKKKEGVVVTEKDVSPTTVGDYITLLKGVFSWAEGMGFVHRNPLAKMPKPSPRVRQEFIPADAWAEVFQSATDDPFRDYLVFMLATGCRAEEIRDFEARHFDGKKLTLPMAEAKGRRRSRVVYLPPEALEIVQRLAEAFPVGPLFRNSKGGPWTGNAIRCRFKRLKRILKMPGLTPTTLRHSFAHHRLTSGQDSLTVSKLMGHVDTRMLATRYGHLDANEDFMQEAANQIVLPSLPVSTADLPSTLPSPTV